jgi:hypothetical protein
MVERRCATGMTDGIAMSQAGGTVADSSDWWGRATIVCGAKLSASWWPRYFIPALLSSQQCHFPGNNKSIYNKDPKEDTLYYFKTVFNDDHILQNIVKWL